MLALAQRRPGMLASVVTGQYCRVHHLLFIRSLQEWLSFSPAQIAHAFGDAMQVVEAPCPQCLAMAQSALQRQFPALYAAASGAVPTGV
jgi:hypothetical protein